MIQIKFEPHEKSKDIRGLWQYDYGRTLQISGLDLPEQVKVEFSMNDKIGETAPRTGITTDGITEVAIPNTLLKNQGCSTNYNIYVFIYIEDEEKGFTYRKIILRVQARPKPGNYDVPDEEPDYLITQTKENSEDIKRLDAKKASLPEDAEGNIDHGADNQVLTSNGDGTTRWEDAQTGMTEEQAKQLKQNTEDIDALKKNKAISWDDLTGKPFGDNTKIITWDGNTEGLETVGDTILYKFSDEIPCTPDDLNNVYVEMTDIETGSIITSTPEFIEAYPNMYMDTNGMFAFVFEDTEIEDTEIEGLSISKGMYINSNGYFFGYSFIMTVGKLKHIDEKFIPCEIARTEDVIKTSDLQTAVDKALTQAKESGEFNGADGNDGADGYTPVKGTDYWTEADKEEISEELGKNLTLGVHTDGLVYLFINGKPQGNGVQFITNSGDVTGYVDSDNNIVLTGNLPQDTYTVKYEMEDGSKVNIGELVLSKEPVEATYTNLFDPSTAAINMRASLSSGYANVDGAVVTDFIDISDKVPFTDDVKIYVKGANFDALSAENSYPRIIFYKTKPSSGFSGAYSALYTKELSVTDEGNDVISVSVDAVNAPSGTKYMVIVLKVKDTAITTEDIQDIVVTLNEPIYL